jgi:Tfp pilus assembly pilus retraction ATPase PilT
MHIVSEYVFYSLPLKTLNFQQMDKPVRKVVQYKKGYIIETGVQGCGI